MLYRNHILAFSISLLIVGFFLLSIPESSFAGNGGPPGCCANYVTGECQTVDDVATDCGDRTEHPRQTCCPDKPNEDGNCESDHEVVIGKCSDDCKRECVDDGPFCACIYGGQGKGNDQRHLNPVDCIFDGFHVSAACDDDNGVVLDTIKGCFCKPIFLPPPV